jgi:hypothetical protein
MAERSIFQSAFSRKKYRFGESEKKSLRCLCQIIAMSSVKHHDVFGRPLGRLFYIIAKTFFMLYEGKKTIMTSSVNHHNASGKPS